MEQPFIYKYRPKSLNDFEMSNEIIEFLQTLINIDNLNILLVGDNGCGKSSLIKCIIKEYYSKNYNSTNILTINSLKDQGISYYRNEVKTFCQTLCQLQNKKKFVVLDDIDYINEQSQQVFRNCIDKYSNNTNFIASCSNIQKVIDSFQSRVMIIKIKPVKKEYLENILLKISKNENLSITDDAKNFLLSISKNSIRTLINYLEKLKLISNEITYNIVIDSCTNISFTNLIKYTELCKDRQNLLEAIHLIYTIYDRGYSVMDILDTYFLFIKLTDILSEESKYKIIKLLCKYITVFHNIHEDEIELALFTNNLINLLDNN